jgi:hypothetical protein
MANRCAKHCTRAEPLAAKLLNIRCLDLAFNLLNMKVDICDQLQMWKGDHRFEMGRRAVICHWIERQYMKKYPLALLALAAALALTPAVMADTWDYTIDGSNFSANLILYTSSNGPTQTVDDMAGTFQIAGQSAVTFGETATENAGLSASSSNLTLSSDGEFLFDNLLYPTASGNNILDWGGLLVELSDGYELNIFSGAFGGSDGTYAPGDTYFYFADNGSYHSNNPIPKTDATGEAAMATLTEAPEPRPLLLLGTGLLGLALALHRKAAKRPSRRTLNA